MQLFGHGSKESSLMQPKHPLITSHYYFYCAAIILFLIFMPMINKFQGKIPYFPYLGVITLLSVLYTFYSIYTTRFFSYIFTGILLIPIFWSVGFPLFVSIIFGAVLTWRIIYLRVDQY